MAEKKYIERGALLKEDFTGSWNDITDQQIFEHIIELAPAADVTEVRHGEWKLCFEDWRQQIDGDECSACGFRHYGSSIRHYNYCPNCGAKMDGERGCANE